MILYSADKKFMGMDYEDLQQLGYKSLSEFIKDYQDFADTFIDRPGYIYNYEDFSWIDYILNSNDSDFKAMIYSNSNGFACDLEISPYFLVSSPQNSGYAVNLHHIRALSKEEIDYINKIATSGKGNISQVNMIDSNFGNETIDVLQNPATINMKNNSTSSLHKQSSTHQENSVSGFSHDDSSIIKKLSVSPNYRFDPIIAAEELGLAVEVIEEFIDDFIEQAYSVKDEMKSATHKKEFKDVEGISHKLKGVAANLRIEDSLEVLTKINSSHNQNELEVLIEYFYTLIEKLKGSKTSTNVVVDDVPEEILLNFDDDETEDNSQEMTLSINDENDETKNVDETPLISIDDEVETLKETSTINTYNEENSEDENSMLLDIDADIPNDLQTQTNTQHIEEDALSLDSFEDIPNEEVVNKEVENEVETESKEDEIIDNFNVELPDLNFNPLQASQDMGIDMELFAELLEDFKEDAQEHLNSIENAIKAQDFEALKSSAEVFKDISDNLHIQEFSSTLVTLQNTQDPLELEKLLKILRHYMSQL